MKRFAPIIVTILLSQNVFAIVYRTISNGLIEDASIWIPSMPPQPLPATDTMIIRNNVSLNDNWQIAGTLIINPGSYLGSSSKSLDITSTGKLLVNGLLIVKNLNNDGRVTNNSRVEVYGNLVNNGATGFMDGTNGKFRVQQWFHNFGANVTGTIDICKFDEVTYPIADFGNIDLSTVTICGTSPVVPVTLVSFTANSDGEKVTVEWVTSIETNHSYFDLEKSLNGQDFESISLITAPNEKRNGLNYYTKYDENIHFYKAYYRLKQVDINGEFHYSSTISVLSGIAQATFNVYPNPVESNGEIMGQVTRKVDSDILIIILDQLGHQIASKTIKVEDENAFCLKDCSLDKPGIYSVFVNAGDESYTEKLVVK